MARIAVPTELLLEFDDAAHDIGYRSATPFIAFALREALNVGLVDGKETNLDWNDGTSTVEIPTQLYDLFRKRTGIDGEDDTAVSICSALIAYARYSDQLTVERTGNSGGHEDEIRQNLKELGYID